MTIPYKDNRPFIFWKKNGQKTVRHSSELGGSRYAKMELPANYPMPAIPIKSYYWVDAGECWAVDVLEIHPRPDGFHNCVYFYTRPKKH